MRSASFYLCVLLCGVSAVLGEASVRGQIETEDVKGFTQDKLNDMTVQLVGDTQTLTTFVRSDGSFELNNVEPGLYALHINSLHYLFPHFRVDVAKRAQRSVKVFTLSRVQIPQPVVVKPVAPAMYFQPYQGFNPMSMLANPMVLMLGFSCIMAFGLPKLMEGIDPEELKKAQAQSPLTNLLNQAQAR